MKLVVISVGGSVISNRYSEKPSLNYKNIRLIANEIKSATEKLELKIIIVHGGGSFIHPLAKKYGIRGIGPNKKKAEEKRKLEEMFVLENSMFTDQLALHGLKVTPIQRTPVFLDKLEIVYMPTKKINEAIEGGFIPVVHSYIAKDKTYGMSILSADHLAPYLAHKLNADFLIGGTAVDGLMDKSPDNPNAKLIKQVTPKNMDEALKHTVKPKYADVTGGMYRKVKEYANAAKKGVKSRIINATKPDILKQTLLGESHGTFIFNPSSKSIKCAIFDMDGILIDSEGFQFEAYRKLFQNYGVYVSQENFSWVGKKPSDNIARVAKENNRDWNIEKMMEERELIYQDIINYKLKPNPAVLAVIDEISSSHKLALASSSRMENIKFILDKFNLNGKFEIIVSGDEVERGKPDPKIFLRALERLGLKAEECIIVEDSHAGIEAASRAGIKCIAIPNRFQKHRGFFKEFMVLDNLEKISKDCFI